MKRLFLYCVLALAGCGGGGDACRCAGTIPGGKLDLACGKSQCVGGVGYRCNGPDQLGADTTVCISGGGTPDLGGNPQNNASGCTEGDPCVVDECNYGVIHCAAGSSECQPVGSYSDGTACSTGTCQQGLCSGCTPGGACIPDGCHTGYLECDPSGNATCISTATLSNGTSCGTGKVCSAGSCVACDAGASCSTSSECTQGVISCTSGAPYCLTSYKANGAACETNKVCDNGACVACVEGAACTPTGTCHTGTLHCGTGTPTCTDMGGTVADGTSCGYSGYVCKSGTCNYCSYPGESCQLDNKCKTATISCDSGSAVCTYTGSNVADGTTCGDSSHVCSGGSCTICKSGVACTPANPCHKGVTSCSTGTSVCIDQSTNAADGSNCGTNMFCKTGVCGSCTEGASCSTGDPCQTGKTTCATGTSVCVPSGATAATTCGNVTKGSCVSGACQCPAGSGFYNGDCQTCAAATSGPVVNANPSVGIDNQCCGRSNTAGFGGPCLTIGQALANFPSGSVTVSGDPQGNVSSAEKYPVHLTKSASITASGAVCIPGTSGKPVVQVDGSGSYTSAVYYFTLGTDCAGNSGGASDGIYVGPGGSAAINATIKKTVNGVHVDTGAASVSALTVDSVSGDGVLCRSDASATTSSFGNGGYYTSTFSISGAAKHDIFASTGCSVYISSQVNNLALGDAWPCPSSKRDSYGIYAEGNASVSLVGSGRIGCMANDGISLRNNSGLTTNAPSVSLGTSSYVWSIAHNGCAGLYAEVGTLLASHALIESNHWGVVQHSTASGSTALVNLSSGSNTLACNTSAEPGACSASGAGADLFNNSGLPLDATGNKWQDSPLTVCNCNSQMASCACTPGGSTPPDGIDVLNAPLSSGTPTTTLTNFTASTVTCL